MSYGRKADGFLASVGCIAIILWASFWGAVIYMVIHFVRKAW